MVVSRWMLSTALYIPHLFALSMQRPITCNQYYYYYFFIIDVIIIVFVRFVFVVVSAFGINADWSCKHRDIDLLVLLPFWFSGNQLSWLVGWLVGWLCNSSENKMTGHTQEWDTKSNEPKMSYVHIWVIDRVLF